MIYEPLSAVEIHLYVLNVFISANIDSQLSADMSIILDRMHYGAWYTLLCVN